MAFAPRTPLGFHHADAAISGAHPTYTEDEPGNLDPRMLDGALHSPDDLQLRKGSFVPSSSGLAAIPPAGPRTWEHHQYANGLGIQHASDGLQHPYHEERNGYVPVAPPPPAFGRTAHPPPWNYEQDPDHRTPTATEDYVSLPPAPYGSPHYVFHRPDSGRGSFSQGSHPSFPPTPQEHFHTPHPESGFVPVPQMLEGASPHCHEDYVNMHQQERESKPSSKRFGRAGTPRNELEWQRRDGIRKKNARIDIPPERDVRTIDGLLETEKDEDVLKELKQQKRLLRNREAALSSRQRKKKHTEDLEAREKHFGCMIEGLKTEVEVKTDNLRIAENDRRLLAQRLQEVQRTNDAMQEERREMVLRHDEETSQLRKRIQILTEPQLEAGPAPMMSAAPSSTGFTDFNAGMEALHMDPNEWDSFLDLEDFHAGHDELIFGAKPEPVQSIAKDRSSTTLASTNSQKRPTDSTSDQPIASGLLFFLLLCGALVASKPPNARPAGLPQVPEDVRAAAPAVLNNLLADSDAKPATRNTPHAADRGRHLSGLPSHASRSFRSRLDHIHDKLTSPSKQQEIDAAFALTPSQYASIMHGGFDEEPQRPTDPRLAPPHPRRNLAEALGGMNEHHPGNGENGGGSAGSRAEVYTRSLLWDQISPDVQKQLREYARAHSELDEQQRGREQHAQRQHHQQEGYEEEMFDELKLET